jgi:RHS repeat-associated protein
MTWDALGRVLTETAPQGTVSSQYDLAGRRTRVTLPGATSLYANTEYDLLNNVTFIRENGATSGVGVLATYQYDSLSRRSSVTFGNGVVQNYTYDNAARLATQTNDLASTANDLTQTFAYNPASQISSVTRSNDLYAWTGHTNQNESSNPNGLNQITTYGAKSVTWDARGNMTAFGSQSFGYSSENLLISGPSSTTLAYDPQIRLYQLAGTSTTRFAYDGLDRIAEYDGSNNLLRRYIHAPEIDSPIVWYEGTGTSDRRFLSSDERRSVLSLTDSSGTVLGLNKYDEFGRPQSTNLGAFGYTGQAWLPQINVWYYKARTYHPEPGRFMQADPPGYEDSPNLYAYVLNSPLNFTDPLGLQCQCEDTVTATRNKSGGAASGGAPSAGQRFVRSRDRDPHDPNEPICRTADGQIRRQTPTQPDTKTASRASTLLRSVLTFGRASIIGLTSLLGGSTPQPKQYRHYGFAKDAPSFAGGLRPGAFATTAEGPPMTGLEAQALLALPHSQPPDAYYDVTVQIHIPQIGPDKVEPTTSPPRPGGGVQYQFPEGTPPGSVGPPNRIPRC